MVTYATYVSKPGVFLILLKHCIEITMQLYWTMNYTILHSAKLYMFYLRGPCV